MNSRGGSVHTEPSISTGHNPDTLRDIRRQIETNNKKHEAVSNFNKRLLFSTILILVIQGVGLISCIIYLFSILSNVDHHAIRGKTYKGVYPYYFLNFLYFIIYEQINLMTDLPVLVCSIQSYNKHKNCAEVA